MKQSLCLLVGLLAGCPKTGTTENPTPVEATSNPSKAAELSRTPTADGLVQVQVDLNADGKPDVWNYYRERADAPRLLMRKETDLNRDTKIDVRTTFDDAGLRVQEDMDGDFDGRADWVDHYITGKRTYSEADTNFDGTFDTFRYYEAGKCRRKERDTNGDGRIDLWEYLDESGAVVKTGKDLDGDGKMDVREQ